MKPLNTNSVGIGLHETHYGAVLNQLQKKQHIDFVEIKLDSYLQQNLDILLAIREFIPISLHSSNLSLGGYDELDKSLLKHIKIICQDIDISIFSDYLAYNSKTKFMNNLLPFRLTKKALINFCDRVDEVQSFIGQTILIKNPSQYITFTNAEYEEFDFLNEINKRTGAYILLDISSLYINHLNNKLDIERYFNNLITDNVKEIRLSGYAIELIDNKQSNNVNKTSTIAIKTHGHNICENVWRWYEYFISNFGIKPMLIERYTNIPSLDMLMGEVNKARHINQLVSCKH